MFDIGFWELCMVGLVALLVIGPERLPKAARIAGFWVSKTRNMVAAVKAEIKDELQAEEMRQIIKEQTELEALHRTLDDTQETAESIKRSIESMSESHEQNKTGSNESK